MRYMLLINSDKAAPAPTGAFLKPSSPTFSTSVHGASQATPRS
jgi:hypothetical protein